MRDYETAYREFSVSALERQVLAQGLEAGANAAQACCDRWADQGRVALEFVARDFSRESVTFRQLSRDSARFANALQARGVGRGDVVAAMLPRIPELLTVVLGVWRAGAIYQPLFTAFGPAAIESRVTSKGGSQAKLVVTDAANRAKLDDLANCPPVLVVDRGAPAKSAFARELAAQSDVFPPVVLTADDPFVMLYTSGTTGSPKGVRYPLRMMLAVAVYMLDGVDLRAEDRFWNVADPGWAYGMLYAVIGPLLLGHATTFFDGPFTVDAAVRVIKMLGITNLASAPTAYRAMMAAGDAAMAEIAGQLRVASSAGEPLNPEVVRWAARTFGLPAERPLRPDRDRHGGQQPSRPAPGGEAGIGRPRHARLRLGRARRGAATGSPGTPGVLAVNLSRSPMFTFSGYWRAESPNLVDDWYVTGDTMTRDADGHFFFAGRNDDIITSAGYRIGPFDVESVIIEHPAVAEVAVVGKPDPERTEIVKAFVVLRKGHAPSDALAAELQQHVRKRLSLHAYPREVEFVDELPKTASGKVQRFLLRRRG